MKPNRPTKKQIERREKMRLFGCLVRLLGFGHECSGYTEINHAKTGMGRRKDHDKIFPLCTAHHRGKYGFTMLGKRSWQLRYDTEDNLLLKVEEMLNGSE